MLGAMSDYAYYEYTEYSDVERYNEIYKAKINKMDSEGKES